MLGKQIVAVMLVSSLICNAVDKTCSVESVKTNSVEQARSLIRDYDLASRPKDKQCKKEKMDDLLNKLTVQSGIFGGAMQDEAMSGELEASIVNEEEQVDLKKSIQLLQDKLASIDGQKPSAQKRRAPQTAAESKEANKRSRASN